MTPAPIAHSPSALLVQRRSFSVARSAALGLLFGSLPRLHFGMDAIERHLLAGGEPGGGALGGHLADSAHLRPYRLVQLSDRAMLGVEDGVDGRALAVGQPQVVPETAAHL